MSTALIQDYLRTQGLKLPAEAVQIAMLTASSVMAAGRAEIEPEILWYRSADGVLEQHLPRNEAHHARLRQICCTHQLACCTWWRKASRWKSCLP